MPRRAAAADVTFLAMAQVSTSRAFSRVQSTQTLRNQRITTPYPLVRCPPIRSKSTRRGSSSSPTLPSPPSQKWNWDWCSRPVSALSADRVDSLLSKLDEALSCPSSAAGGGWGARGSRSVAKSSNPTTAAAATKAGPATSAAAPQAAPGAAAAMAADAAAAPKVAAAEAPPSSPGLADDVAYDGGSETRTVLVAAENAGVPVAAASAPGKNGRGGGKEAAAAAAEGGKADKNALTAQLDEAKPWRTTTRAALQVSCFHLYSRTRSQSSMRVWCASIRCRERLAVCLLPRYCVAP